MLGHLLFGRSALPPLGWPEKSARFQTAHDRCEAGEGGADDLGHSRDELAAFRRGLARGKSLLAQIEFQSKDQ